jgi:acyl-CoA dehydrogenase
VSDLRDLVRDVLAGAGDHWATMTELGLTTVGVPEEHGGSGGTLAELAELVAAVAQEGAGLPLVEHATSAWALAGLRPRLGTVVIGVPGEPLPVPWGERASHVVVVGPDGDGPAVLERDLATVEPGTDVAGHPLDTVVAPAGAFEPLPGVDGAALLARLAVLRAAAMVGAGRGAYLLARTHTRVREQFGRPLVRIPAVGSAVAELRVEVIQAEVALRRALPLLGSDRGPAAAAVARVVCGAAASRIARLAHQVHGAVGITLEYPLHRRTRLLWALRDADLPEEHWAGVLGECALVGGEELLWDDLTAG